MSDDESERVDDSTRMASKSKNRTNDEEPLITTIDCFRILFGLLLLNSLLSYFITGDSYMWNYNPYWMRPKALAAKLVRYSHLLSQNPFQKLSTFLHSEGLPSSLIPNSSPTLAPTLSFPYSSLSMERYTTSPQIP